jgi:hypothetical protein
MLYTNYGAVVYIIRGLNKIDDIDMLSRINDMVDTTRNELMIAKILEDVHGSENILELSQINSLLSNGDYYTFEQSFNDITCGLKINKPYRISDLVCAIANGTSPQDFFGGKNVEGVKCTPIGHAIASNIIRVASKRIFADPSRSFVEPIANSIDSYREKAGKKSNVGKFGMGFFSLLYWLKGLDNKIYIRSVYKLENNDFCYWQADIRYNPIEDQYYFNLISSEIVKNVQTGTNITILMNNADYNAFEIRNVLIRAFSEVTDIRVDLGKSSINDPITFLGVATLSSYNSQLRGFLNVSFGDEALGMPLSVFLSKLLVPSISTKTIKQAINQTLTWSENETKSGVYDKDGISFSTPGLFVITVGGFGIYFDKSSKRGK